MMKQLLVIGTIILAAGFILGSSQLMAITVYAQQSAAPQNMTTATNTTNVTNTTAAGGAAATNATATNATAPQNMTTTTNTTNVTNTTGSRRRQRRPMQQRQRVS